MPENGLRFFFTMVGRGQETGLFVTARTFSACRSFMTYIFANDTMRRFVKVPAYASFSRR
jgi:hypothetical protein